jgi:predicted metal-dependent phosphoesterase TrpH
MKRIGRTLPKALQRYQDRTLIQEDHKEMPQLSKADLHIHTIHSHGAATVPELLAHVVAKTDLRLIALTDHDSIAGARQAAQLAPQFGVEVVIGEEVSSVDGHLLALFIDAFLPPGRPAAETIAAIHAQGGLAIAPHPFDRSVPSLGRSGFDHDGWDFDAIEGFNAGVVWWQRGGNGMAQRAATRMGLPLVGGSDAHALVTTGLGYTLFPGAGANDLYRAIRAGQTGWGGQYWSIGQYTEIAYRLIRQHSLLGALGMAAADAGLIARHQ